MTFDEKLEYLRNKLEMQQIERLHQQKLVCEGNLINAKCSLSFGKKYIRLDIGTSGRYMIENETGAIYGIKAYGVIHRGHYYGTLETVDSYNWGDYTAYSI